MKKSKKFGSKTKQVGAVIYVNSDTDVGGVACVERLDEQEARCRKFCAEKNLEVLGVFRDRSWSYRNASRLDKIIQLLTHSKEFSIDVYSIGEEAVRFSIEHHARFFVKDMGNAMRVLKITPIKSAHARAKSR